MLYFCVFLLTLLPSFHSKHSKNRDSNDEDYEWIEGIIYADNWFQFWFNNEFIIEDSILFIPHQATKVSFKAPKEGKYTFAIYATDYSQDNLGALEYDGRCIGDGGLRAMFSDGTVTNNEWKCKTIYYGPTNLRENGCFGDDTDEEYSNRFVAPVCKNEENEYSIETGCTAEYYPFDLNWYLDSYDDTMWNSAVEFSDDIVGWGVPPTDDSGLINPRNLNWNKYGNSSFICRYTYTRVPSSESTFNCKSDRTVNS